MLSKELHSQPVLSLRSGGPVAVTDRPIIDPNNLKIIGWWCNEPRSQSKKVLLVEDVREFLPTGLAINDHTELVEAADLVRHQKVLALDFSLIGKTVRTKSRKLGKVSDYSFNDGYFVQKLYVEQPMVKVLSADTLIVDRTQIIEITDHHIVVKDAESRDAETVALPKLASKLFGTTR